MKMFRIEDGHGPARLIGYKQLAVPGNSSKGYFDRLRALTLPITPLFNDCGGLDGTIFHLAIFGDLYSAVRFKWWSDPPAQWVPLIEIANEMIDVFRRLH